MGTHQSADEKESYWKQ